MSEKKEELSAKEFTAFVEDLGEYLHAEALKRTYTMLKICDQLVGNLIEGQVKRGLEPNAKLAELHKLNGEALAYAKPMYDEAKELCSKVKAQAHSDGEEANDEDAK